MFGLKSQSSFMWLLIGEGIVSRTQFTSPRETGLVWQYQSSYLDLAKYWDGNAV